MSISNENYDVGGTGGALFAESGPKKIPTKGAQALGDEYKAPPGLPGWKQPSYDDDDRVDPASLKNPMSGPAASILSRFFPDPVDQSLALAKFFYFFFFAAFGSLLPLLGVYFKQQGMDASQCGFLMGIRAIIEYLATPFWNKMSGRFQKGKIMLLIAVGSWIVFTLPIGFIHPPVVSCKYFNGTQYLLKLPKTEERTKRSVEDAWDNYPESDLDWLTPDTVDELPRALPLASGMNNLRMKRGIYDHRWAPGYVVGTSPQAIMFTYNYNENKHKEWVSPAYSNEVFERAGVHKVFFLITLLVIIGEFFSSPAIALADSAVITLLGEQHQDRYGKQRMWGSIGWAATMFFMGMVLDHSHFEHSKCDPHDGQKNYHVCFFVFAFLMFLAFLVATQIPFRYSVVPTNNVPMTTMPQQQLNGEGKSQHPKKSDQGESLKNMAEKTKVFAMQLRSMPEFNAVFKAMANIRLLTFMLVAWIMGIGMGLIFTFLFWHLQDFGGGPTLFGIASVINHISEMAAFFYSFKIINKFGHIKVLAAGLLCSCIRFLYISFITWPWLVLPFEFVQGITHAAMWAACCSFITHNTDAKLRSSAQGFLQGIHHGFGKFCGAVFGGMLIKTNGTVAVFRAYGFTCLVVLVIFIAVNFYNRSEGELNGDLSQDFDPRTQAESVGTHLTPHGVPSGGMSRALSNTTLEQPNMETDTSAPNLGVPGAAQNPFLADAAMADANNPFSYNVQGQRIGGATESEDQYYGRGYSQAQSGYSSSGFGKYHDL
ncbi:hypothetical protein TCAL_14242 [Tigriopus californicus]|uniref:Major facilitator superfamily associated domain-containing protein n=1 Tax=Tigriopus californicus TaxID=6832 RepID=A0A553NV62_TIGCA|nr:hypothetical protein TCAL_14242 [Tigriopus californicus]